MRKNMMICFRADEELRDAIEAIAKEERQSVSMVIKNILYKHLGEKKDRTGIIQENRRYPRKSLVAPALLRESETENTYRHAGIVVDVSLNGLQVSIPDRCEYEILEDREASRISIVFALPDSTRPVTAQCVPKRISPAGAETRIGASIVDMDFESCQAIQYYLLH